MRIFLWLVALMAAAIGIAVTARFNPGNVVLLYPPHRIDLSLNLFCVLLALLFVLLYVVIRAVRATVKMPRKVAAYRRHLDRQADDDFEQGKKPGHEYRDCQGSS